LRAKELQPDLILLDIGLPQLNGIEAAQQIRKLVPCARIVFFSQEASPEVVEETLSLGRRGYVYKPRAASDLLCAVEMVLRGEQFVGGGLMRGWPSMLPPDRGESEPGDAVAPQ